MIATQLTKEKLALIQARFDIKQINSSYHEKLSLVVVHTVFISFSMKLKNDQGNLIPLCLACIFISMREGGVLCESTWEID